MIEAFPCPWKWRQCAGETGWRQLADSRNTPAVGRSEYSSSGLSRSTDAYGVGVIKPLNRLAKAKRYQDDQPGK